MSPETYCKDKRARRNGILFGMLVWLFLLITFSLLDIASYYMTVNKIMAVSPKAGPSRDTPP